MADSESLIPYPEVVREALRAVPREVLSKVAKEGLPGEHHFFIEFRTPAEGVDVPDHLRTQYPEKMTIVLQHDFTGLEVDERGFAVELAFGGIRKRLYIPFAAMTLFVDPSVEFALQFASTPASMPKSSDAGTEEQTGNVVKVDFSRKS